jgi:hypothetical protein
MKTIKLIESMRNQGTGASMTFVLIISSWLLVLSLVLGLCLAARRGDGQQVPRHVSDACGPEPQPELDDTAAMPGRRADASQRLFGTGRAAA